MTQLTIGYLCVGTLMLLVLLGFVVALWDALVNKDRASLTTLTVIAVLVAGAVWGLNA